MALAFAALILGYLGLDRYFVEQGLPGRTFLNIAYFDLQLFVLGADPLQEATALPPTLQIARFAAPAVTLFALAEAARLLLSAEFGRLRARSARGHAIVCGDSTAAATLARNLATAQRRTVLIRTLPSGPLASRRDHLLSVTGDATDPDILRGAGVAHATVIYACTDDSATNVAIAAAAGRVIDNQSGRATVYAQIHDPERAVALQARRLGVDAAPNLRLDFFNLDQLAVQVLLTERPPEPVGGHAPRLLIAGDAPFARALLVSLARGWRLRRPGGDTRIAVDFVRPGAGDTLAALRGRYRILDDACEITAYETDVPSVLAGRPELVYDDAYLCYRDEEYGLDLALTTYELWHRVAGTVLVPVDRLAGLTDAFGDEHGRRLLDQVHGKIKLFPKHAAACDPALIAEDLVERLARLIHERYLIACRELPDEPTDPAALVEWDRLDEERRASNRSQADSIGAKLGAIGCTIVARSGSGDFALTEDEVELLARAEQARWAREARAAGWRYGPARDPRAKLTPYLLDWADLPDERREKNRAAVRDLPTVLADAGFQVVRLAGPQHARTAHLV
ncbi:NAD-binding protein [Actinoplanes sp. NPDC048796]|uniref:NAD-binding protein n=1 Tax=unclassified Actinoplanes TaxID=2626549 RepID=UPI0033FC7BE3